MWQEMNNAEVIILAVTDPRWHSWKVWGSSREIESIYQAAMKGRWPYKRPAYRVVARRKAA